MSFLSRLVVLKVKIRFTYTEWHMSPDWCCASQIGPGFSLGHSGMAQWLGRRSPTGALSLIYG